MKIKRNEIKTTGCVPDGEHAGIWINTFGDSRREKIPEQIIQDQKLRELIEKDIKRCFGELICPKNADYGTALQNLLIASKK